MEGFNGCRYKYAAGASREELQALMAAQAQDRERIARLATKADVSVVLTEVVGVKKDVAWLTRLLIAFLSLSLAIFAGMVVLLFRLFAGGVP